MQLTNTTAIITGSTGHLGGAIAHALARMGCNCVCHYNTQKNLAVELVSNLQNLGAKAVPVSADLTSPDDIKRLFFTSPDFPPARVLINSAAIFPRQPLSDITLESARHTFDTNIIAPILVSARFADMVNVRYTSSLDLEMRPAPIAKIINLTDVGADHPWANYHLLRLKGGPYRRDKIHGQRACPSHNSKRCRSGHSQLPAALYRRAETAPDRQGSHRPNRKTLRDSSGHYLPARKRLHNRPDPDSRRWQIYVKPNSPKRERRDNDTINMTEARL